MTTNTAQALPTDLRDTLAARLAEALATAYADKVEARERDWMPDARREADATFTGAVEVATTMFPTLSRQRIIDSLRVAAAQQGRVPVAPDQRGAWIGWVAAQVATDLRAHVGDITAQ